MIGPCMCGDTHCPSCGPAQGNWRCPLCGVWADDGCDHIGEDGKLKPEFRTEAEEKARQEAEAEAKWQQEEEALIFADLDTGGDPRDYAAWIVKKWREARGK